MKMVKSLILGSAAGLVAMSGAQAADLPVKAKAVEYVRICSLYGAGFFYIPGTDTCIKLGGYLRVETAFNASVYNGAYSGQLGAQNRLSNYYTARSREDLTLDTRTATEYGVVRTFFDATFSWTTGQYAGLGTGGTLYSGAAPVANPSDGGIAGGSVGVYHAFIQFAGFTMGKTLSPFDSPWQNYPGNNFDGLVGGSGDVTAVNQLTYDAQFGNGVSGTVALVDPTAYHQSNLFNLGTVGAGGANNINAAFVGGTFGLNAFGGTRAPDIIGRVKVDQAWGIFQVSAVAHDLHAAYYSSPVTTISGTEFAGAPSDKWGWAVQGAVQFKTDFIGAGDTLNFQAVYTDGASRYNFQSLSVQSYGMFGGSSLPGVYQSVGLAAVADGAFATGTAIETVKTWGLRGAYNHNWDPYWNSALYGAYAQVQYGSATTGLICGALAVGQPGIINCDPNFAVAQIGVITRWTPVKNLTFSLDTVYTRLDQKFDGVINVAAPFVAVAKPPAIYQLKDQSTVSMLARVQRNF